jgi:hypothetical protein
LGFLFGFVKFGAGRETRTPKGYPIRPSNVRVYQFRHTCSSDYYNELFHKLKEFKREIEASLTISFEKITSYVSNKYILI